MCCGKKKKEITTYDLCVIYEPCDNERVVPLLDIVYSFKRPNGKEIRVYPPKDAKPPYDLEEKKAALMKAHAILLVLSDLSVNELKEDEGDKTQLFDIIKRGCKKMKKNQSRILPLFLSNIEIYEGIVGTAKYHTWVYKNQKVQNYMLRVGSLQGLFVDPHDWESKLMGIRSFWEDTHAKLVPLNCSNFKKEVDWTHLKTTGVGAMIGFCLCPCSCCCLCCGSERFRFGITLGVIIIFLIGSVLSFVNGFKATSTLCSDAYTCQSSEGYGSSLFTSGTIMGLLAITTAVVGRSFYVKDKRKLGKKMIKKRKGAPGAINSDALLASSSKDHLTLDVIVHT